MRILKALSHRPVVQLWAGQCFSSAGDEIFRVALVWMLVNRIGADTGYLAAGQAAAVLAMSLFGGIWADQWDARLTMIRVDLLRGAIVLLPVAWHLFHSSGEPPLALLMAVALSLASLSAFFDPALQTVVPGYVRGRELRQAANALMGTTLRLARVVGPAIVAALTGLIPMVHFFTVDALTFAVSAFSIATLPALAAASAPIAGQAAPRPPSSPSALAPVASPRRLRLRVPPAAIRAPLTAGYSAVREHPTVNFIVFAKAIVSGGWMLSLTLGFALLTSLRYPGDVRALGLLYSAYGAGNLAGTLLLGSVTMRRPERVLFSGYFLMGAGFAGVALAPTLPGMMACAAVAAVGGPMNDLPFTDLVQSTFPVAVIPRIYRFLMAAEYTGMLVCMLASPTLYRILGVPGTVVGAGATIVLMGALGLKTSGPPFSKKVGRPERTGRSDDAP